MLLHAAMRASKNWAIAERSYFQPWPRVCHQRSSQHLQHRLTQEELILVNGDLVQCSLDDSWRCRPCSMVFHRANSPRHSQNWLLAEVIQVSVDQEELSQDDSWHCQQRSWEYHQVSNPHHFHTPNLHRHLADTNSWNPGRISPCHWNHWNHQTWRSQLEHLPGHGRLVWEGFQRTKQWHGKHQVSKSLFRMHHLWNPKGITSG